jgi:hypothetical protein
MHLSTARLEAEFSPVSISDVLYLSLPACRDFGLLRHGGLAACNACGRRQENRCKGERCAVALWLRFDAI